MEKIKDAVRAMLAAGEDFVVASVVDTQGSAPRKKGAFLIMKKDGTRLGTVGGGRLEAETERIARETFQTGKSGIYHFRLKPEDQQGLDMRCGGDADIEIEYISARNPGDFESRFRLRSRALIFGGGHVGLALEPVLRHIDFETAVADDREEYANRERFPHAAEICVISRYDDCYPPELEPDENTYVIIVTRGHSGDYDVLKQTLKKETAYIGMIGSRNKVAAVYEMLEQDGFTKEELSRVHAPIGLRIGAETPEEIGVSIAAELIQVRARREKGEKRAPEKEPAAGGNVR